MSCKIRGCRYASYHNTAQHECGTCHQLGHGRVECKNDKLKRELSTLSPQVVSCKIRGCRYASSHDTAQHECGNCHKLGHGRIECKHGKHRKRKLPNQASLLSQVDNPHTMGAIGAEILRDTQNLSIKNGQYTVHYGGMGSTWYIRNNKNIIEYLFMHGDSWGQYGKQTSDVPRLNAFLQNFVKA